MRHCEYKKYLSSYVDGQLDPIQESQVEEHLPLCRSCKVEWEELTRLKTLCTKLPEEELPQGLHQRILNQVKLPEKSTHKGLWLKRCAVPLAAALFIFLVSKFTMEGFSSFDKSTAPGSQISGGQADVAMATRAADEGNPEPPIGAPKDSPGDEDGTVEEVIRETDPLSDNQRIENENSEFCSDLDDKSLTPDAAEEPGKIIDDPVPEPITHRGNKAPFYKDMKFGLAFTGAVITALLIFRVLKRKR
ncbi:MAG: zf-HC2 domain-containing protein [Clostridia bacterium]|nr:zf-HC2 domain-containing protein [Clostridia bacterium]